MTDITTVWAGSTGDWQVSGAALLSGSDLETGAIISLFTDRVLPPGVLPPDGSDDARGWWADDPAYPIGSRIWTLLRAKQTTQTLNDASAFIAEALQWQIDDGIVASFDITTEWDAAGFLAALVVAHKPDGSTLALRFRWAWDQVD